MSIGAGYYGIAGLDKAAGPKDAKNGNRQYPPPPIRRQPNWVAFNIYEFSFPRWGTPDGKAWTNCAPVPAGRKGPTKRKPSSPKIKSEGGSADLRRELAQARRELTEARQQQTATADVLKVISRSPFDIRTVLTTLVSGRAGYARRRMCKSFCATANSIVSRRTMASRQSISSMSNNIRFRRVKARWWHNRAGFGAGSHSRHCS